MLTGLKMLEIGVSWQPGKRFPGSGETCSWAAGKSVPGHPGNRLREVLSPSLCKFKSFTCIEICEGCQHGISDFLHDDSIITAKKQVSN